MHDGPVTDAKFKPVHPKGRWVVSFDWRNFLFVAAVVVSAAVRTLLPGRS